MRITLDTGSLDDYRLFLKIKSLPRYAVTGHDAEFPDEYARLLGLAAPAPDAGGYAPRAGLFDYQRDLSRLAVRKRKFAVFLACGYGKTLVMLEYARHVAPLLPPGRCLLVVSPLMVVRQTLAEAARWYGGDLPISRLDAAGLQGWLDSGAGAVGITNYEAVREGLRPGRLAGLVLDESSLLKSHYGAWGRRLVGLGRGLDWKLCLTGTPAPNDRIEFANHAVFLDRFPTVNSFLARFFVNRGKTQDRWALKPHALRPFYAALSDWCVFVGHPAAYGWRDNAAGLPPVNVHVHDVPLTDEQAGMVSRAGGDLFGTPGGITSRSTLARLAKGTFGGKRVATNKTAFIRDLIAGWSPEESTLVWCRYNAEQDDVARGLPGCGSLAGDTPQPERERLVAAFQAGELSVLVSKPKCLGFGLNLQRATRQVFSTCQDSWEEFHQAVKRSNRVGSARPLNVHVPVTELERPMLETVLRKARRVEEDAAEQQRLFGEHFHGF